MTSPAGTAPFLTHDQVVIQLAQIQQRDAQRQVHIEFLQGKINDLEANNAQLSSEVTTLNGRVTQLNETIIEQGKVIERLASSLSDLEGRFNAHNHSIRANHTRSGSPLPKDN